MFSATSRRNPSSAATTPPGWSPARLRCGNPAPVSPSDTQRNENVEALAPLRSREATSVCFRSGTSAARKAQRVNGSAELSCLHSRCPAGRWPLRCLLAWIRHPLLRGSLIPRRGLAAQRPPNRVLRQAGLTRQPLDRLSRDEVLAPQPRPLLHTDHPLAAFLVADATRLGIHPDDSANPPRGITFRAAEGGQFSPGADTHCDGLDWPHCVRSSRCGGAQRSRRHHVP